MVFICRRLYSSSRRIDIVRSLAIVQSVYSKLEVISFKDSVSQEVRLVVVIGAFYRYAMYQRLGGVDSFITKLFQRWTFWCDWRKKRFVYICRRWKRRSGYFCPSRGRIHRVGWRSSRIKPMVFPSDDEILTGKYLRSFVSFGRMEPCNGGSCFVRNYFHQGFVANPGECGGSRMDCFSWLDVERGFAWIKFSCFGYYLTSQIIPVWRRRLR